MFGVQLLWGIAEEPSDFISDSEGWVLGQTGEKLMHLVERRLQSGKGTNGFVAKVGIPIGEQFSPKREVKVAKAFETPQGVDANGVRGLFATDTCNEIGDKVGGLPFGDLIPGGPHFPEVPRGEVPQQNRVGSLLDIGRSEAFLRRMTDSPDSPRDLVA